MRPGDLGRLIALHGTAYGSEENHFGHVFEAYVARTIAEFVIDNKCRGRIWFAEQGERLVGTAAMVERREEMRARGQLRWVVADPSVRGHGIGKRLIGEAMAYARAKGFGEVFLETTPGLDASMGIYRKLGFKEVSREQHAIWLDENTVITMALSLE